MYLIGTVDIDSISYHNNIMNDCDIMYLQTIIIMSVAQYDNENENLSITIYSYCDKRTDSYFVMNYATGQLFQLAKHAVAIIIIQ